MTQFLSDLAGFADASLFGMFLVFIRAGAVASLLPGFGNLAVPTKVRLGAALAFAVLTWPLVQNRLPGALPPPAGMGLAFLAEAANGLVIGIGFRLMVMALQLAGSVAAQSTSLSQIFGAGATPDPLPAIGNILVIAGIAMAMAAGLHVRAVQALSLSYDMLPAGQFPPAADIAAWGVARIAGAFEMAITLAAPFVLASLAYNVALGAINRAMPQLMVAFIGAPAITAGGILMLMLSAPVILEVWQTALGTVLADPLGPPP